MRICLMLDDVLRAKTKQFGKIYKKFIDPDINLDELDISSGDLRSIFKFKNNEEFQEFLYKDYAYEIFAEAPVTEKMVDKELNLWHLQLSENDDLDEPIELIIASTKEYNFSIGFTCFFLARIATHVREIYFPRESSELWDKCDVLVTADKNILDSRPEGKKTIKINMPYNEECKADLEYETLSEMIHDEEIINKLIN